MREICRQIGVTDFDELSYVTGVECTDPSLTDQSGAKDADINVMMERMGVTGQIPMLDKVPLNYDFDKVIDFRTAMEAVVTAREMFMNVPAKLRQRFNDDPQEFVDFCSNPANIEELRSLGLAKALDVPPEPAKPVPAPGA